MISITIHETLEQFLELINASRSKNTYRSYSNAINAFISTLKKNKIDLSAPAGSLGVNLIGKFANDLRTYSPSTEQMYLIAAKRFYHFLAAEEYANINLDKLDMLVKTRSRKPGQRLPQFPKDSIEKVIDYAQELSQLPANTESQTLINLRDRAFIITLADTGLRVHEACELRRGDIDWKEYKAFVIGKGNTEAVIRFSSRAINAIKAYLEARSQKDGQSGRPLPSLHIFSRHDKGAGKNILSITTTTGRKIIETRVLECLGEDARGTITPHSFRHYFVTNVLQGSGGNLKLAQSLARHKNIQVTQRYAHLSDDELDRYYHEIFEESK